MNSYGEGRLIVTEVKSKTQIPVSIKVAGILWIVWVFAAGTAWCRIAPYEVGQYWEYEHKGPRPGAVEPNAIDGHRILQVLDNVVVDAREHWVIEERFTNDPNVVGRQHVNGDRKLTAIVIENEKNESLTLMYNSPTPYQYVDIDVGVQKQLETELVTQPGGFKLPGTIEITRLDDETIETQAGQFADCRQYSSITVSIIDIKIAKISVTERRQWWYSDKVGATVKEIYSKDPVKFMAWSKDGYTSTSTLTAFGVRGVSDQAQTAAIHDVNAIATMPADHPPNRNWPAILAVLVCLAAGGALLRRYKMRGKDV